ncbi:MAG: hypothetical protein QOG08_1262, partial [Chloroflexota bacterium]|nr:hypothetical protein [Chloroflexota bacterium]
MTTVQRAPNATNGAPEASVSIL